MGLDLDKFRQAQFESRTEAVPVPEMAYMFGKKDKAEWVVRGLSAIELQRATDASAGRENAQRLLSAITDASIPKGERDEAIKGALGISVEDVPHEIKKRIEFLVMGTVGMDDLSVSDAVILQERHPIEFMSLTNKIINLTGQGQIEAGESKPSGKTKA